MVKDFIQFPSAATQPVLCPDDLLIMYGGLKWDIAPPPGCLLVMKSFSEKKMLLNALSPYTLPCMTFTTYQVTPRPLATGTINTQAIDLLKCALDSISVLKAFFKQRDFSSITLKFRPRPGNHILCSLQSAVHGEDAWEACLRRIIGMRCLVLRQKLWASRRGQDLDPIYARSNGLNAQFLRCVSLNGNKYSDALEIGHKLDRIERRVGEPGISLVWVSVLPFFHHLYHDQVQMLIQSLLSDETYRDITKAGKELTSEMQEYQDWQEDLTKHFNELNISA